MKILIFKNLKNVSGHPLDCQYSMKDKKVIKLNTLCKTLWETRWNTVENLRLQLAGN